MNKFLIASATVLALAGGAIAQDSMGPVEPYTAPGFQQIDGATVQSSSKADVSAQRIDQNTSVTGGLNFNASSDFSGR